jgi:hypothetical protein
MIGCPTRTTKVRAFLEFGTGHRSLNIVAVCNIRLLFMWVSLAHAGCNTDGRVFADSEFRQVMHSGNWLPQREDRHCVPCEGNLVEPFLVGDAAFPASPTLVKPYSGSVMCM